MGKARKIGIALGLVLGVFIILGIIGSTFRVEIQAGTTTGKGSNENSNDLVPSLTNDQDKPSISSPENSGPTLSNDPSEGSLSEVNGTLSHDREAIPSTLPSSNNTRGIEDGRTQSLADLVPTREEIGTKWYLLERKLDPSTFGQLGPFSYSVTDFEEAIYHRFMTPNSTEEFEVTIYRLSSTNAAGTFHSDLVAKLKERGGYQEVANIEIGSNCYITDSSEGQLLEFYCVKSNIFYHLDAARSSNVDRKVFEADSKLFANSISSKISS
jgi:hypothetical protein